MGTAVVLRWRRLEDPEEVVEVHDTKRTVEERLGAMGVVEAQLDVLLELQPMGEKSTVTISDVGASAVTTVRVASAPAGIFSRCSPKRISPPSGPMIAALASYSSGLQSSSGEGSGSTGSDSVSCHTRVSESWAATLALRAWAMRASSDCSCACSESSDGVPAVSPGVPVRIRRRPGRIRWRPGRVGGIAGAGGRGIVAGRIGRAVARTVVHGLAGNQESPLAKARIASPGVHASRGTRENPLLSVTCRSSSRARRPAGTVKDRDGGTAASCNDLRTLMMEPRTDQRCDNGMHKVGGSLLVGTR